VYVDDAILLSPDKAKIDECIHDLQASFNLTEEGDLADYLGLRITRLEDGSISLTQPQLIDSILNDLNFSRNTKPKTIPAPSTILLHRDVEGQPFDEHWSFRSVIGKLNFLEKSSRPDLAFSVHQCARFSSDPKKSHADAIKHIGRYLMGTRDKGIILKPDNQQSFIVYADADFVGNWRKETAESESMTAKSRTGFAITYSGCPISWTSKMQTEVALSTTESEYISLSSALRDVIPLINLTREYKERYDDQNIIFVPTVRCTLFEDNTGALELANTPKMRPRTKHINVKYHHFRDYVRRKIITIQAISTTEQIADLFTKPLPQDLFRKFRDKLQNW
jgi:hypothetical protein